MKKVISGCIDQVIQFDSENELNHLIESLKFKKQRFSIVWKNVMSDGKIQIRIKRQYNNHFMEGGDIS